MTDIRESISRSAKTALVDSSTASDDKLMPLMIFNNPSAGHAVLTSIEDEFSDCISFSISVAFISLGGISSILDDLSLMRKRGIQGRILTTDFLTFNDPKALRWLLKYDNLQVRILEGDLHTKGYIFHKNDHSTIIIGSSNLTDSALKSNMEWNIRLSSTEQGDIVSEVSDEFERMWNDAIPLTDNWISDYQKRYDESKKALVRANERIRPVIKPTAMQEKALEKIEQIRSKGGRKALIVSATGTGKTYISAFDVKSFLSRSHKFGKVLFMVHNGKILQDAMESYKNVLGEDSLTYGIYKGSKREKDADCLFASVQTLVRHLNDFDVDEFDYIVCDEAHHIVTKSQMSIITHFNPRFMLGMTATPERPYEGSDNVFEVFDFNVPFEVRLSDALEEKLVCPFHYFGIADIQVNGKERELRDFHYLGMDERVQKIVQAVNSHPISGDRIRGLIFCSGINEAKVLEQKLSGYYRVKALTGETSEDDRNEAFDRLQEDDGDLDFIIAVDILNEGVDLPRVNEIVMLRPTQSSIIFIQQLGRGLRKRDDKEFVTVLDFIGNYDGNYNIPIALFGDDTRNKENLRRKLLLGSRIIPGASTVSFDEISKERIFRSINSKRMSWIVELKDLYRIASMRFRNEPVLCELYEEKGLDPRSIIEKSGSLNAFWEKIKSERYCPFSSVEEELLQQASILFVNGLRPHECVIVREAIAEGKVSSDDISEVLLNDYGIRVDNKHIIGAAKIATKDMGFVSESLCEIQEGQIVITEKLKECLNNDEFRELFMDALDCGLKIFESEYKDSFDPNFDLSSYKLYSRADFCRLISKSKGNSSTIYGYKIMDNYCPIFVTLKKIQGQNQMYSDHFIDRSTFFWESRYPRNVNSKELKPIIQSNTNELKILLFVQKDGSDGTDFYYCGRVRTIDGTAANSKTLDKNEKERDVVSIQFKLDDPVPEDIYSYLNAALPNQ